MQREATATSHKAWGAKFPEAGETKGGKMTQSFRANG